MKQTSARIPTTRSKKSRSVKKLKSILNVSRQEFYRKSNEIPVKVVVKSSKSRLNSLQNSNQGNGSKHTKIQSKSSHEINQTHLLHVHVVNSTRNVTLNNTAKYPSKSSPDHTTMKTDNRPNKNQDISDLNNTTKYSSESNPNSTTMKTDNRPNRTLDIIDKHTITGSIVNFMPQEHGKTSTKSSLSKPSLDPRQLYSKFSTNAKSNRLFAAENKQSAGDLYSKSHLGNTPLSLVAMTSVCVDYDVDCPVWYQFCGFNEHVDTYCHYSCGYCLPKEPPKSTSIKYQELVDPKHLFVGKPVLNIG